MKKVLAVFGTRPDAIKMCPVVNEMKKREGIAVFTCVSGQHRELLLSVLDSFGVTADHDLKIMKESQTLFDITVKVLEAFKRVLEKVRPDIVLVHGDTSTAFAASLASFYLGIPVGHIEAGLRSGDILEPYPEEYNRRAISIISAYDFAPTEQAKMNLVGEGKREDRIFVTGNTVIDSLRTTVKGGYSHKEIEWAKDGRMIIFTAHRRENIGEPMKEIFRAIKRVACERKDVRIVYPIHPNPAVRALAEEVLSGCDNIHLIEPLDVIDFHNFLARSYFIVTDSGGIQEEAAAFHKPVLVLRNKTERAEGIETGGLKLIGTNEEAVCESILLLLSDENAYKKMSNAENPYGDGMASKRIADIIEKM